MCNGCNGPYIENNGPDVEIEGPYLNLPEANESLKWLDDKVDKFNELSNAKKNAHLDELYMKYLPEQLEWWKNPIEESKDVERSE
jgi:hypothetical protein